MVKLFSDIDLMTLKYMPRDQFGPGTHMPLLAIDLDTTRNSDLESWLSQLPCPVIGLGKGPLAPFCDALVSSRAQLDLIHNNTRAAPLATMILVQHLRASEALSATDALIAESFAYAALQNGPELFQWLQSNKRPLQTLSLSPPLRIEHEQGGLSLTMTQPERKNAIGTEMRDALCEALDLALLDDDLKRVTLTGVNRVFSTGGALEEFGEVSDPATAHWIRSLRLPAWRLARLSEKLHVHVNGAAIGAGAEMAAFGQRVTASPNAWFQLPELKYGLIPGAGGTVSLPRRIGRQRTAYMALTMSRIRAKKALDWGLIDAVID